MKFDPFYCFYANFDVDSGSLFFDGWSDQEILIIRLIVEDYKVLPIPVIEYTQEVNKTKVLVGKDEVMSFDGSIQELSSLGDISLSLLEVKIKDLDKALKESDVFFKDHFGGFSNSESLLGDWFDKERENVLFHQAKSDLIEKGMYNHIVQILENDLSFQDLRDGVFQSESVDKNIIGIKKTKLQTIKKAGS